MLYDLAIIGGGPAGAAAAVYAARKRLKTVFITDEWGGQSTVSTEIQNWIGTPALSGAELAANLRTHVESYAGDSLSIVAPARAASLAPKDDRAEIALTNGTNYEAKAVLVAAGARRRKLEIPGAAQFDQKGLTYCASCDGPLFADKDVAVIGGGNAAFETAAQLLAYCKTVTLFNRTETFRADEITVRAVLSHPNMRVIKNAEPTAILGSQFVEGVRWKDMKTGKEEVLPVAGVFVEIGLLPNTEWLGDTLVLNKIGQIIVDPRTQRAFVARVASDAGGPDARRGESGDEDVLKRTAKETQGPRNEADGLRAPARIWAAGDCTDGAYHQNNIAAGDAVKALEDIYMTLRRG